MSTSAGRPLVLLLAVAGLAAAATSSYVHYQLLTVPNFTSFCDVNTTVSCTQAYLSQYGELWGVPVALFGMLYFAVVLAIAGLVWRPGVAARDHAPAYIFAFSLPALGFVLYLAVAAFFILHAFCILCVITYVAVIGIAIASWRASKVPFATLPARAARDFQAVAASPLALGLAAVLVIGTVAAAKAFPRSGPVVSAPAVAALPVVGDAEREKLEQWWEVQPKVDVPVDGGGAKVVVVKFNDYQCPLCGLTYNNYKPLFQKYGGAVKLVTKHYPLEGECNASVTGGNHFAACEAAAAVIMARAKGTGEKLEDWIFSHMGPPILTPAQVREAARDVAGITDFDAQYPEVLKQVRADAAVADGLKVTSTPTFYINGRKLPQAVPAQYLAVLLELELKRP